MLKKASKNLLERLDYRYTALLPDGDSNVFNLLWNQNKYGDEFHAIKQVCVCAPRKETLYRIQVCGTNGDRKKVRLGTEPKIVWKKLR
jgi:hypothetical protein